MNYTERLRGYFHTDDVPNDNKEEINDEIMGTLLGMLSSAMDEMDIDAADKVIDKLSSYKLPQSFEESFGKLKTAVAQLDQDRVSQILTQLQGNTVKM